MCCRCKPGVWLLVGTLVMMLTPQPVQGKIEFGIPEPMPAPFNVGGAYGYPWFSESGLDIYFSTDRSDPFSPGSPGSVNIVTSHRNSVTTAWGPFVDLGAPVNTPEWAEFGLSLTADEQQMYFARAVSPFGVAQGDLFVSERQSDNSWGVPQPLVELNTPEREHYPSVSPDGLTIYFTSFGNNSHYPSPNGLSLSTWVATRSSTAEPFGTPEFFFDGSGIVTADGLTHLFAGDASFADFYGVPNLGGPPGINFDFYIRTRENTNDEFGPVQFLPPPIARNGFEGTPWISAAASTFYFASIRPGTDTTGDIGFVDMWEAPLAEAVPVDIKPGSEETPINLKSKGVLPVALLSTSDFDATQVDAETLLFGDPLLIADGKTPVSPLHSFTEDVDHDGLVDLTLKFSMRDLVSNEVLGVSTLEGYLAGQMFDGTQIAGREAVRIVGGGHLVPEPASMLLLFIGWTSLAVCRIR